MHEEILSRVKPEEIGTEVINHMKSLEPTYQLYDRSKVIMSEAGFDIRKWETNHKELRAYITSQESCQLDTSPRADDTTYSKTTCNSSIEETKHSMVLGLE